VRRWRHWTVRSRMVLTIVALCAMALAAAVLAATALLQGVLTDRIDGKLLGAPRVFIGTSSEPPPGEEPVRPEPTADMPDLPYIYSYDSESRLERAFGGKNTDPPSLTGLGDLSERVGTIFTVEDEDGGDWRVLVKEAADGDLVLALSAEHVQAATESLLLIGGASSWASSRCWPSSPPGSWGSACARSTAWRPRPPRSRPVASTSVWPTPTPTPRPAASDWR
jgi:two-component system OmpR family sensor kinase